MISNQIGYCPYCHVEIYIEAVEADSNNLIFTKCRTNRCRLKNQAIKTDPQGFILDPYTVRGRYVFSVEYEAQ